MNTKTWFQFVGSLVAGLALTAPVIGCSDSDSTPPGDDPVTAAFLMLPSSTPPLGLHIVTNCRLIDTRGPSVSPSAGPNGELPALVAGNDVTISPTRDFTVQGFCNVPAEAKAIAAHIATVNSADIGFLMIAPANGAGLTCVGGVCSGTSQALSPPLVASLNYVPEMVAADATTLELGDNGIRVFSNQNTHFVLDVTGYYTELPQPPIRVTPTSLGPWSVLTNVCGTPGVNDVPTMFTNGEAHTPPLGTGSFDADLTQPAAAANGSALASNAFNFDAMSNPRTVGDISGMRFSSRQDTLDSPYVTIDVDSTGGSTRDKTLYFFPANNPTQGAVIGSGVWQTWEPTSGLWSESGPSTNTVGYSNDFSVDIGDWAKVPAAASGMVVRNTVDDTGTETDNAYTQWGGYSSVFPAYGYTTSIDVFVDTAVTGEWDFTSAVNNQGGTWQRDFIFNASADTAGTWNFSASNLAVQDPLANPPCATPVSLTDCYVSITGAPSFYTFEHNFHDNGSGVLEVTLTLRQTAANGGLAIQSWVLSNPSDLIASVVGGNRYGWFVTPTIPLKIDNEILTFHGGFGPGLATFPLSNFNAASILGVRAVQGCTTGASSGHEAVDDFEMAFDGNPATIYDFERQ